MCQYITVIVSYDQ